MKFIYGYQRWLDLCRRSAFILSFILRFYAAMLNLRCTHGISEHLGKVQHPETGEMDQWVKCLQQKRGVLSGEVETGGSLGSGGQ